MSITKDKRTKSKRLEPLRLISDHLTPDHLISNQNNLVHCCYFNRSAQFQIVRISNTTERFFERVVPPQTSLIFEAFAEDLLEIHTGNPITSILSDTIPCGRLSH